MLDWNETSRPLRGILVATMAAIGLVIAACGMRPERVVADEAAQLTGGDPQRGRERIRHYGCGSCHTIPGVRGARAQVGPPLAGIASRMYIAGLLANDPANMMRWIQDPPSIDSLTAMPNLGVSESDSRDIAAYLYTLH